MDSILFADMISEIGMKVCNDFLNLLPVASRVLFSITCQISGLADVFLFSKIYLYPSTFEGVSFLQSQMTDRQITTGERLNLQRCDMLV